MLRIFIMGYGFRFEFNSIEPVVVWVELNLNLINQNNEIAQKIWNVCYFCFMSLCVLLGWNGIQFKGEFLWWSQAIFGWALCGATREEESLKIFYMSPIKHYLWHLSLFIQARTTRNGRAAEKCIASLSLRLQRKQKLHYCHPSSPAKQHTAETFYCQQQKPQDFQSHHGDRTYMCAGIFIPCDKKKYTFTIYASLRLHYQAFIYF